MEIYSLGPWNKMKICFVCRAMWLPATVMTLSEESIVPARTHAFFLPWTSLSSSHTLTIGPTHLQMITDISAWCLEMILLKQKIQKPYYTVISFQWFWKCFGILDFLNLMCYFQSRWIKRLAQHFSYKRFYLNWKWSWYWGVRD